MNINELQVKQRDVELTVEVTEVGEPREFQRFGTPGRVSSAKVKDSTGEITLTLWNEQIDLVKVGDKLELKECFVNEWQGEKQLTTGRKGTITKI